MTDFGLLDGSTMKDLDLKRHIILSDEKRENMLNQLSKDAEFLSVHSLMDYSLLLGLHYMKIVSAHDEDSNENEEKYQDYNEYFGGIRAHIIEGPGIYYFGIIDYLQSYSLRKRMEHWLRANIQRLDAKGISCVDPKFYKDRFLRYMQNVIISAERYRRKLKLNEKKFRKEEVLIYPSSESVNQSLDDIKRERSKKYSQSFSLLNSRIHSNTQSLNQTLNAENEDNSLPFESIMFQIDGIGPVKQNLSAVMEGDSTDSD